MVANILSRYPQEGMAKAKNEVTIAIIKRDPIQHGTTETAKEYGRSPVVRSTNKQTDGQNPAQIPSNQQQRVIHSGNAGRQLES